MGAPIFFLTLALSLLLTASRGAEIEANDPVLDTDGNHLLTGALYRVLPAIFSQGGGLYMSRVNGTCPAHIVQHSLEVKRGQPVMFFTEDITADGIVRSSTLLYVHIPRPIHCPETTLWKVDKEGYVTTGGITAGGADPHYSRFSIFKADADGYGYVIQSCPCKACRMACSNVAVGSVNGRRLLGVNFVDESYEVVFVKSARVSSAGDILLPATIRAED